MEAQTKPTQPNCSQPGKSIQMGAWLGDCLPASVALLSAEHKMDVDALNPASTVSSQHEHQHKARRLRGGGAGRVGRVSFRLHPCIAPGYRIDAPRRASISRQRLSHHFTVSPLALDVDPHFPVGLQNCFIGLIECFICFGTYCFLPFRKQMMSSSFLPRMLQGSSLTTCLPPLIPVALTLSSQFNYFFYFTFRLHLRRPPNW